ncbi:DUF2505 domain-containing protein [Nocardioides sp. 1609]|uniref:DUF2505 domain-containing protein n=1 Tax=Nocardioides sp. 1609 TaxID=2508327 RepID=UPI00106FE3D3|nr:DUF2505 domain-containing protein [Nocardioides sp. 1609]
MAKSIRHEMPYDAPVETVAAMLADPAFREEVCRAQGAVRHHVSVEGSTVTIDQWLPTAGVPSFARKIVGDETNIVQVERWGTPSHGDVEVSIPGKPGEMKGSAVLVPSGAGTLETVELTVKVSIPLVGGKLEGLIADLLLKALKAEHRTGIAYLSR